MLPIGAIIIGPPGSGKTSVASAVATSMAWRHISSGAVARTMAQQDAYAAAELSQGKAAPEIAMRMEIQAQIEASLVTARGFVLEGFPRSMEQLIILERMQTFRPMYFMLNCPLLECIRRVSRRDRDRADHPDALGARLRAHTEITQPVIDALLGQTDCLSVSSGGKLEHPVNMIVSWLIERIQPTQKTAGDYAR